MIIFFFFAGQSANAEIEEEEFDWEVEQTPNGESEKVLNSDSSYGFGNLRSGVFQRLQVSFK